MLSQTYTLGKLRSLLVPREDWHPFPTADEREPWQLLPESVQQAHIRRGEAALGFVWPPLPATYFLDFVRTGKQDHYIEDHMARRNTLADLVLAECIEHQGRFLDDIVNGVWVICEESYWGVTPHLKAQKAGPGLPDFDEYTVDLFAAETSALLAWTVYLLGAQFDVISPLIRGRVQHEIDLRILTPLRERNDFSWMGFYDYTQRRRVNNWNPWINSNWLITALLMEHDAERRLDAVAKSIRSLDAFLDPYPRDGGCDEGPSYWTRAGASLLDCLELLLSTTGGAINVYDDPLIREIGRFIYRVHIADDNFVNFADAPARFALPAPQVFLYGQRIGDDRMMQFGAYAAAQQDIAHNGVSASLGRRLYALSNLDALLATKPVAPYPRDAWLPDIEVMTARDRAGSPAGYFVAAKGGHNAESHNHNDVGTFVVYKDGKPLIIDAGVETYTAKTFSPQRYEIWTMQSAYHNLPTIVRNDITVMQADGEQFAARNARHTADDAAATLEVDIAPAYPVEAGLTTWQRTVTLWRGESVIVTDAYELTAAPNALTLNLMTCCAVDLVAPGRIVLHPQGLPDGVESAAGEIAYPAETFAPSVEEIALTDTRLRSVWGEHLWRIVLTTKAPPARGTWTVSVT